MKIYSMTSVALLLLSMSLPLDAQEGGVGPVLDADALFKSCENGALYQRSLEDPDLLTNQAHIEAGIDFTFCRSYVQGVFEGARYVYIEENPGKLKFCPNEKTLDDFVSYVITMRKQIPELGREGRMASQDIIQLLAIYWKCEQS